MEKPSWAFKNVTYFNKINNNDKNYFIFSDFEHNWDFFQFLTNENKQIQQNDKISVSNRRNISTITFAHNCIIITKKTKEEIDFYGEREYRFKDNL